MKTIYYYQSFCGLEKCFENYKDGYYKNYKITEEESRAIAKQAVFYRQNNKDDFLKVIAIIEQKSEFDNAMSWWRWTHRQMKAAGDPIKDESHLQNCEHGSTWKHKPPK